MILPQDLVDYVARFRQANEGVEEDALAGALYDALMAGDYLGATLIDLVKGHVSAVNTGRVHYDHLDFSDTQLGRQDRALNGVMTALDFSPDKEGLQSLVQQALRAAG
jgi:pimeloyl-CoA synthetase